MTDPISDMLIRIKNAQAVRKSSVAFSYSKLKMEIAKVLEKNGYLSAVEHKGKKQKKMIEVKLNYDESGESRITDLKRVSKPSHRIYAGFKDVRPVKNGTGIAV